MKERERESQRVLMQRFCFSTYEIMPLIYNLGVAGCSIVALVSLQASDSLQQCVDSEELKSQRESGRFFQKKL